MAVFSFMATIATFAFQTLTTHILTTEDYGILARWLTDIGYLGMFFVLGLDSSILYHAKLGQKYEDNMGKNFIIYLIVFLLSFGILFFFGLDLSYYGPLFVSIISLSVLSVFKSYFHYQEQYLWFNLLGLLKPLALVIVFGSVYLLSLNFEIYETLNLYALISILVLIITGFKYFTVSTVRFTKDIFKNISYFFYGIKSILNKVLSLTLYAATVYILSFYGEMEMVAFFFVASSISKMVWVLPDSAGNLLYPRFLKIGKVYKKEEVLKEMNYYAQIVFVFNILSILGFLVLGHFILSLLYSETYQVVFIPVIILLIGNQGMVYFKLISRYLASVNNWKPLYFALAVGIIVNVGLNFILIPQYGLIGASIATSLSFIACGIFISFFIKGSLFEFVNILNIYEKHISRKQKR
ncbi:polysaccharide biosynthesis C-terminal domain-containing protein [Mesonia sp. MT50]|uniref:Polysaccharide biosynthesis C-terminal domain-containing protein n=1 Tax=Mesonia profundi TaxID=3070998 RepID=A0ABU1A3R3_9FLAO|nr:polysaccharide biosynthesis C-terminal domain-containing protein [Mesonia profundi]MDQ7918280.1 polysaccharide biosynthesis C-terminal domain-containing protein [Mesonia profundi]